MNIHQKLALACNSLHNIGVELTDPVFTDDGQLCHITVGGFSKSGVAKLETQSECNEIWVHTRYAQIDRIIVHEHDGPSDIVEQIAECALDWWRKSYARDPQTYQPSEQWKGYWLKKGWIKENVTTVVTYS